MDWLFDKMDRRGKSVANSAQKVVADMHHHLDEQKGKVAELESYVQRLQSICTAGLEQDLQRLEIRKRELVAELQLTDEAILDRQEQLKQVRAMLASTKPSNREKFVESMTPGLKLASQSELVTPVKMPSHIATAPTELILELEKQYQDETHAFLRLAQVVSSLLFCIHRNNSEEVIVYQPRIEQGSSEFVTVGKLPDFASAASQNIGDLSTFEKLMAYGGKVVANHDRDFPSQHTLNVPNFLVNTILKADYEIHNDPTHRTNVHHQFIGHLIGAFEIPLTPGVIIDVWAASIPKSYVKSGDIGRLSKYSPVPSEDASALATSELTTTNDNISFYWVTTPIDSIPFAVLQRMYVVSVSNWGVQSVVQVDLFGRHPEKGHILLESVTSTAE